MPIQIHPSDKFFSAFGIAQHQVGFRARIADVYPLTEFWKDKTEEPMKDINAFIEPILESALERQKTADKNKNGPSDSNAYTLLDDLVTKTDGE
jgi:hypothetical protein